MNNLFDSNLPEPDFRVPFRVLLSVNDVQAGASRNNAFALAGIIKKWRKRGRARTVEQAEKMGLPIVMRTRTTKHGGREKRETFAGLKEIFFREKIVCILRIWRSSNAAYDVLNPYVKPVIDGMVDVGLMEDDSFAFMPDVIFHFESVDTTLKLDQDEKGRRNRMRERLKRTGSKKPMPPLPARFWFDFYKIARFENCSPIGKIK